MQSGFYFNTWKGGFGWKGGTEAIPPSQSVVSQLPEEFLSPTGFIFRGGEEHIISEHQPLDPPVTVRLSGQK